MITVFLGITWNWLDFLFPPSMIPSFPPDIMLMTRSSVNLDVGARKPLRVSEAT